MIRTPLKLIVFTLILGVFFSCSLHAEIQKLVVIWTRGLCLQTCANNLESEFRKMAGVENVQMNQPAATAVLKWREGVPFTFQALEAPLSKIGLSIEHLRTQVRGTISHDDRTIWLSSIGDGTRFVLVGSVIPSTTGFTETYNVESYVLSPEQRAKFIDAERQNLTVTVDGPIFMPERAPPLVLIAEKSQFEQPKQSS